MTEQLMLSFFFHGILKKTVLVLKIRNNLFILGYFPKQEKTLSSFFLLIMYHFLSSDKSAAHLMEKQVPLVLGSLGSWHSTLASDKFSPSLVGTERPNLNDWSCQLLDVWNSPRCLRNNFKYLNIWHGGLCLHSCSGKWKWGLRASVWVLRLCLFAPAQLGYRGSPAGRCWRRLYGCRLSPSLFWLLVFPELVIFFVVETIAFGKFL